MVVSGSRFHGEGRRFLGDCAVCGGSRWIRCRVGRLVVKKLGERKVARGNELSVLVWDFDC